MTVMMWSCSLARAADWTDHLVPSQFLSTNDFPLAGIDLRVDVQGRGPPWLHLDPAVAEALLLHGKSLPSVPDPARFPSSSSRNPFITSGQVGEHRFRDETGLVDPDLGARAIDLATEKAGSVGVAAFDGSWLVLDLAEKRVAVLDTPDTSLDTASCWVDITEDQGRHWVYVDGFGGRLFETGSAPHGVWTNAKGFETLTGKKPDPSMKVGAGYAFGRPITLLGAPSQVTVRAGKLDLGRPLVTYVPEKR